jgi:hypothetical protein
MKKMAFVHAKIVPIYCPCKQSLSRRTLDEIVQPSPMIPYYEIIKRHQASIQQTIERFRILIVDIHQKNKGTQDQEYQVALGLRKQILDSFFEMDRAAKAIKGFPGGGNVRKVYDSVFASVVLYLQNHMFTLEALPFPNSNDVPIQIETAEAMAIRESIQELESALDDCISKRRLEDAEQIRRHISQLREELSKVGKVNL